LQIFLGENRMPKEQAPLDSEPINGPAERAGHEHILVTDDDVSMSNMVRDLLADSGYDVALASNGPACIEQCRKRIPDLILLDIRMPGMDGFEVCRKLKKDERTAKVPIMLLSALTEPEHKIRGFALGVFDYLTKPFSNEELLVRVENILTRQRLLKRDFEESKLDTIRQLSVTLADQINNPLASIMAGCQILSKHIDNREKVIEVLEMITDSVNRIYTALFNLTSAPGVKSTEYSKGIRMIDVEPSPPKERPTKS